MSREGEIQSLCISVINNHTGLDRREDNYCIHCYANDRHCTLTHKPDCVVLIAKDLTTNIKKEPPSGK